MPNAFVWIFGLYKFPPFVADESRREGKQVTGVIGMIALMGVPSVVVADKMGRARSRMTYSTSVGVEKRRPAFF